MARLERSGLTAGIPGRLVPAVLFFSLVLAVVSAEASFLAASPLAGGLMAVGAAPVDGGGDDAGVAIGDIDSGCFIATAAYGSPLAREVVCLSRFRDRVLLRHDWGRAFVRFYYRHSPSLAAFIRPRPFWRALVRSGLRPVIWLARLA